MSSANNSNAPGGRAFSRRYNNAKWRGDWRLVRHRDGTRTWTTRHGYRVRQAPPTHLPEPPGRSSDPPPDQPDIASGGDGAGGKDPPDPRAP